MARRKRDYYVVLGVERGATEGDLKRAFRELARKHHPDVDPTDKGERFREINEAYAVLSDRDARARYDRWGHADGSDAGGFGAVVDAAQEMINDVLRRRRGKQKGGDLRYTLELTFEEAAFGCSKAIQVPDAITGKTRQLTVAIPPGAADGALRTFKGDGEASKTGGGAGDLHVVLRVAEHAEFRREGHDVRSEVAISFAQAALGGVIDVKTLDGEVKMRVPEGTQPGRVFRIRARGIPQAAGKQAPRGDHLVAVMVEVPTELTAKQRELIEELARASGEQRGDDRQPKKRLLDRVRSLLDE
nr:DnaJ C-terminal domain-containing protein [Kofleriaceae bacterium]